MTFGVVFVFVRSFKILCLIHTPPLLSVRFTYWQKEMEDLGESGATFEGMKRWIQKAEPPIVILENVYGTYLQPWCHLVMIGCGIYRRMYSLLYSAPFLMFFGIFL